MPASNRSPTSSRSPGASTPLPARGKGDLVGSTCSAAATSMSRTSSLVPPLALDPQPGEDILDLCASPGGKASHIAALTGNKASLWLNDGLPARMRKLREVSGLMRIDYKEMTSSRRSTPTVSFRSNSTASCSTPSAPARAASTCAGLTRCASGPSNASSSTATSSSACSPPPSSCSSRWRLVRDVHDLA